MKKLILLLVVLISVSVAQAKVVWWNKEKAPANVIVVLGVGSATCASNDSGFGVIGGAYYEKPIVNKALFVWPQYL